MMKKILGIIAVVAAFFLIACTDYSIAEQKYYDACVKADAKVVKLIAKSIGATTNADSKKTCATIISKVREAGKKAGKGQKDIDTLLTEMIKYLSARI